MAIAIPDIKTLFQLLYHLQNEALQRKCFGLPVANSVGLAAGTCLVLVFTGMTYTSPSLIKNICKGVLFPNSKKNINYA